MYINYIQSLLKINHEWVSSNVNVNANVDVNVDVNVNEKKN